MILKVISKYGLAAHLGLLASMPVALAPFLSAAALGQLVLWLSFFAAMWVLFDPSIRIGERSSEARGRVFLSIVRDPIFYFFLVLIGFALVRYLNSGIALQYDAEQSAWTVKEAAAPVMPASAGDAGFLPLTATVGLGVLVVGIRHGLGLSARVFCGLTTVSVVGAGGLWAAVQACLGKAPALLQAVKADFVHPPFMGSAFGTFLVLAVVFGMDAECRKWSYARLPYVVAVAGTASGLVVFSPPAIAALYLAVTILFAVFASVYSIRIGTLGGFARSLVFTLLGLAVPALLLMALASPDIQQFKLFGLDPEKIFPVEYNSLTAALARISKGMWMERPWCGVGVGAFGLHVPFVAVKADWAVLPPHVGNALSGYWTLLAERGIVGCALLAVGLAMLLWSWGARLRGAFVYLRGNADAEIFPFACPPVVWTAPFIVLLGAVELFVAPVFSSIASVFSLVVPLALSAASFPRSAHPAGMEAAPPEAKETEGK